MDLLVGDIVQGVVSGFGSDGEGVVKSDGYPIFVPFAIKGEEIRARVVHVKKDCAFAEVVDVLSPSEDRIKPLCPYFGKCGGCDLQHISSHVQLEIKRDTVQNALKKIAGLDIDVPLPVRLNDWEYRNKLSLPFAYNKRSKRISLGFYEKRTHRVVPMKWCPLHGQWAARLIECVTEWATEYSISVYDENERTGLLRHIVARMLDTLSLTVVINGSRLPRLAELADKLKKYFADFAIYVSENTRDDNVILGKTVRLVYGAEKKQNLGKFRAVVSPKSFLQVNAMVCDVIYDEAARALENFDGDIVELYSGVGILTAQIALRLQGARITAVEIEPSADEDAKNLMKSLGLSERVENVCGDAATFLQGLDFCGDENKIDDEILRSPYYLGEATRACAKRALILDPPRKGCDKRVLDSATGFEKIVYISCNPQTLARDLKILARSHVIDCVKPFDMFPQTSNVETLVVLSIIDEKAAT